MKRVSAGSAGRPTEENGNIGDQARATEVWIAVSEKEVM